MTSFLLGSVKSNRLYTYCSLTTIFEKKSHYKGEKTDLCFILLIFIFDLQVYLRMCGSCGGDRHNNKQIANMKI